MRAGPHLDRRIDQPGRADHLLGEYAASLVHLPGTRRRRDADRLRPHRVPFLETQRPVVHAGWQPEAVFGERRLAAEVAAEHAAELRHGDVALVGEDQRVVRHVFEQGGRRFAGLSAGEIARIVLDAGAASGRFHHFEIIECALLQPLRLQQPAGAVQFVEPLLQLDLDAGDRLQQRRPRRDVVRVRVHLHELQVVGLLAGERIELLDLVDLVAEQVDAPRAVLVVRREDVDGVAAHPERAAREVAGALVLQRHQVGEQLPLVDLVALLDREGHRRIGLDRADAVDARHRGHDHHVVALQQRARRGMAHAVDLLVDRGFLLDVGVGARHVRFRLVVVVVRDEILHRVVGEEAPELAVELRGQRLVRRQDQRRALRRLDHLGHREGLARAGDAEQHLRAVVALHALDQVLDRGRLVALRLEIGFDLQADAALGFLRPRRAVRCPHLRRVELGAALAQQPLQRFHAGGDAERDRLRRRAVHLALLAPRLGDVGNLVERRRGGLLLGLIFADQRLRRIAVETERLAQFCVDVERGSGIERTRQLGVEQRALRRIAGLRALSEAFARGLRRFPALVLAAHPRAPLERVVRRLLQAGSRPHARGAALDARIEQPVERGLGRRRVGPRCLGAGRACVVARFFRFVGRFRHRVEYGAVCEGGKVRSLSSRPGMTGWGVAARFPTPCRRCRARSPD